MYESQCICFAHQCHTCVCYVPSSPGLLLLLAPLLSPICWLGGAQGVMRCGRSLRRWGRSPIRHQTPPRTFHARAAELARR